MVQPFAQVPVFQDGDLTLFGEFLSTYTCERTFRTFES